MRIYLSLIWIVLSLRPRQVAQEPQGPRGAMGSPHRPRSELEEEDDVPSGWVRNPDGSLTKAA